VFSGAVEGYVLDVELGDAQRMTFLLVPHEVTDTTATIWVGAVDEARVRERSVTLAFEGNDEAGEIELDNSAWSTWESYRRTDPGSYPPLDRLLHRLLARSTPVVRTLDHQRIELGRLQPRTSYSLKLRVDGRDVVGGLERYLREGRVTTLPATLPTEGEKPFTLLVGSCFYGPEDPDGLVGTTYRHMPEDRRPDVKFLCGDQVYLDNPWRETTLKWYRGNQKPGVFRAMLFRKYLDNWRQVRGEDAGFRHLLADGANYFCSDDHEFWNNAPNFGGVGLANTLTREQRKWWLGESRRLFRAFQSPSPLLSFEVPPLSVCVVDTRIYRHPKGGCFMKHKDLRTVARWIEELQGPGVLVVGQPVLVEKTGFVRSLIRKGPRATIVGYFDKNLPDYAQYEELIGYIRSSDHSIVVLTGDVHFGRVVHGELRAGSPAKLVEVISSPMQAVLDDKGEPLFGGYKEAPTDHFRGLKSIEVARKQNHFATVEFRLGEDGQVNMTVWCWPIMCPAGDVDRRPQTIFEATLP
jgi:hypothetical protein